MKRPIAALIMTSAALLAARCGTSVRPFEYREEPAGRRTILRIYCRDWSAAFPPQWKAAASSVTRRASVIELYRDPPHPGWKSRPHCLVTAEPVRPGMDIGAYTAEKFTKITARMLQSGYGISRVRHDIIAEVSTVRHGEVSTAQCEKSLRGFAYELKTPPSQGGRTVLAIALFARKDGSVLSLSFEMEPGEFRHLKEEIMSILSSL
jgi:hypothetical protein